MQDLEEFTRVMQVMVPHLDPKYLPAAFRVVDKKNVGCIEFDAMMAEAQKLRRVADQDEAVHATPSSRPLAFSGVASAVEPSSSCTSMHWAYGEGATGGPEMEAEWHQKRRPSLIQAQAFRPKHRERKPSPPRHTK